MRGEPAVHVYSTPTSGSWLEQPPAPLRLDQDRRRDPEEGQPSEHFQHGPLGGFRAVDQRDKLLRGQDAVRLDDEFGDLVPVGGGVERETHRVAAPAEDVEGKARVPQRRELLARGAEGHDHVGAVQGVVDPEHVHDGPFAHPPSGADPGRLLVGVREGEAGAGVAQRRRGRRR